MGLNSTIINKINNKSKLFVVLFCVATFLNTIVILHDLAMVVIADSLYGAFPDTPMQVTLILSAPAFVNIFACLIAGALLKVMSTKTQLFISNALMLVFGIWGAAIESAGFIIFTAIMLGVSAGFANTAGCAILGEIFQDEKTRSRMLGFYGAAASAMGIVLCYGSGLLAVQCWQNVFDIYWISVPILILGIFFLPNIKPSERVDLSQVSGEAPVLEGAAGDMGTKNCYPKRFWTFFITLFLFYIAYDPFMTFSSLYVAEHNLGTSVYTGTFTSLTTFGGMIAGIVLGPVFGKLRRRLNYIILLIPIASLICLTLFPNRIVGLICAFVIGLAYGSWYAESFAYAACCVPLAMQGMAIGIMAACNNLGFSLGNLAVPKVMELMNTNGLITPVFKVSIAIWVVALIFEHFNIRKDIKDRFMMEGNIAKDKKITI